MDDTTVLYLIAFGAALHGDSGALDRIKGNTMPPDMKRAFREIKAQRKVGPATKQWMQGLRVNTSDGVLEGVLRLLEQRETRHAEVLSQYRAAFERNLD